ncbi:MAG: DUF4286 family protein [Microbacter sp.]
MILLNTTFYVDQHLIDEWHAWIVAFYFPLMAGTQVFMNPMIYRIQPQGDDEGSVSFAVQFSVMSEHDLELWENKINAMMQSSLKEHFGEQALCFSTVLESWPSRSQQNRDQQG